MRRAAFETDFGFAVIDGATGRNDAAPAPSTAESPGALILDPKAGGDQPQGFAGTGGPSVAIAPVARVGSEILVNTTTAANQTAARVTTLSNGGFVVTWTDFSLAASDTDGSAVRAQVFTASGGHGGDRDPGQHRHHRQPVSPPDHRPVEWRVRGHLAGRQRERRRHRRRRHPGPGVHRRRGQGRDRVPGQHRHRQQPEPATEHRPVERRVRGHLAGP